MISITFLLIHDFVEAFIHVTFIGVIKLIMLLNQLIKSVMC